MPCFDGMESYLEYDSGADDTGNRQCPPHEWYKSGILEIDEVMMPKFLEVLSDFDLEEIPLITDEEIDKVLDWEICVKEKPSGFMRL